MWCMHAQLLSLVRLLATPWTVTHQAPLSMGFSRQEYWSGWLRPPPGDLPDYRTFVFCSSGVEGRLFFFFFFLPLSHWGSPLRWYLKSILHRSEIIYLSSLLVFRMNIPSCIPSMCNKFAGEGWHVSDSSLSFALALISSSIATDALAFL